MVRDPSSPSPFSRVEAEAVEAIRESQIYFLASESMQKNGGTFLFTFLELLHKKTELSTLF